MKRTITAIALISLSGCMGTTQSLTPQQTRSIADPETLALSCAELSERNNRITARLSQLEAESKARQRGNVITDTAINVGLGAILGVGARSGLSGIRAASATIQGIEGIRAAERGQTAYSEVTDVMALAQRSAILQRTSVENGCE